MARLNHHHGCGFPHSQPQLITPSCTVTTTASSRRGRSRESPTAIVEEYGVIGLRLVNRQAWERNWTTDMDATVSTPNFSSSADTDRDLGGKTILIVEGSLLSGAELADAFHRAGAHVHLTTNIINAFNLLRREQFDGAVVDQGRHNEAFDLCSELKYLAVPYICSIAPHRHQKTAMRKRDADHAVRQLASKIFAQIETPPALRRQRTRQERWKCLLVDRSDERTAN
jgi:hypothetical protein